MGYNRRYVLAKKLEDLDGLRSYGTATFPGDRKTLVVKIDADAETPAKAKDITLEEIHAARESRQVKPGRPKKKTS